MTDLTGRTVLLTGASKGIGAATARALGDAGAHLIAHYHMDRAGAIESTTAIPVDRKLLVAADLGLRGEAERLWAEALGWRSKVDVIVNNAAVMEDSPLDATDDTWGAAWDRAFAVNVRGTADLTRAAVRHFVEQGGGVVITLSSWVAERAPGNPSLMAYAASKAAVRNLTQTVARHYGRQGVLAYVIAPGVVGTRMSEIAAEQTGGIEAVKRSLAMGEWIPPQELGGLIAFLATGTSRHLSGATLDVNGASYIR